MSKPLSISSLLKRKEEDKGEREKHQVQRQSGIPTKNRFLLLAEKGKAARERSLSAKRFRTDSECTEASEIVEESGQGESVFASMEDTERQLKEAKMVIDQVKSEVEKIPDPGPLKAVLDGLLKWMALTTSIQENSASVMLDEFAKASKKVSPPPRPQPPAVRSKEVGSRERVSNVSRTLFRSRMSGKKVCPGSEGGREGHPGLQPGHGDCGGDEHQHHEP
jgi:hypothetical protein